MNPIIYVATPFAPEPDDPSPTANVEFARSICKRIIDAGGCPYAPHLLFPQFLDDTKPLERELAIKNGLTMLTICTEAWFVLPAWRSEHSRGMRGELRKAHDLKKPIRSIRFPVGLDFYLDHLWRTDSTPENEGAP